jgi:putative transposase
VSKIQAQSALCGIDARLKQIIRDGCRDVCAEGEELEVLPDLVHLLVCVDPQFGMHRLINLIKGRSSRLLRQAYPSLTTRMPSLWTNSYFVATVGGAPLEVITHSIEEQKRV